MKTHSVFVGFIFSVSCTHSIATTLMVTFNKVNSVTRVSRFVSAFIKGYIMTTEIDNNDVDTVTIHSNKNFTIDAIAVKSEMLTTAENDIQDEGSTVSVRQLLQEFESVLHFVLPLTLARHHPFYTLSMMVREHMIDPFREYGTYSPSTGVSAQVADEFLAALRSHIGNSQNHVEMQLRQLLSLEDPTTAVALYKRDRCLVHPC